MEGIDTIQIKAKNYKVIDKVLAQHQINEDETIVVTKYLCTDEQGLTAMILPEDIEVINP